MNCTSRSLIAALLIAVQAGTSFGRVYTVKTGDTLSKIVDREMGRPIYGKKGNLKKVLNLNPDISNPNMIKPKQNIVLSPDEVPAAPLAQTPVSEPAVAAAPAQAPQAADNTSDSGRIRSKANFGMDVDVLLSKTTIDATSKDKTYTSSPHSKLNRGLQVRGYYLINPDAAIGIQIGVLQSEFAESIDDRLSEAKKNLKQFSLFYHQILADRIHLEASLGSEQVFFMSQYNVTEFALDPIFVDYFKLGLGYDLVLTQDWRWNLEIDAKLNQAADGPAADAESGHSYGASTLLSYRLHGDLFLNTGLQFQRRVQNSSQATQRNTDIGASVGLTVLFW